LVGLENDGVVEGLTPEQSRELARLVRDLFNKDGSVPSVTKPLWRGRRRWRRHGAGYFRQLRKKSADARNSVQALLAYLQTLEVKDLRLESELERTLRVLDDAALAELQRDAPSTIAAFPHTSRRLTKDALVALHDFFVKADIPPGEAEARTATISNDYWGTKYKITEMNSDGERSRGCDAVRRRVARRRAKGRS
jgi:hypothetical protein